MRLFPQPPSHECVWCDAARRAIDQWLEERTGQVRPLQALTFEDRAPIVAALAVRIREAGWEHHQHQDPTMSILRVEEHFTRSGPDAGPELCDSPSAPSTPPDIHPSVRAAAEHLATRIAATPHGSASARAPGADLDVHGDFLLPWASGARPTRLNLNRSASEESFVATWAALVEEIAAGWKELQPHPRGREPGAAKRSAAEPDPGFVTAAGIIFLGPKGRLIDWPREVNDLTEDIPVAYGRAADLLMDPDATCACKSDLCAAFKGLRVALRDRRYLGVIQDGVIMRSVALPFGLKHCPRWFVQSLRASITNWMFRAPGEALRPVDFVDDLGTPGRTINSTIRSKISLLHALLDDGWLPSLKKTFLLPATLFYFLGFIVDFETCSIRVHPGKAKALIAELEGLRARDEGLGLEMSPAEATTLEHALGVLSWFSSVIPWLLLWTRRLRHALTSLTWHDDAMRELVELTQDLLPRLHEQVYRPNAPSPPTLHVVSDASETGWGAILRLGGPLSQPVWLAGVFREPARNASSTARELEAIHAAIQAAHSRGLHFRSVLVDVDSQNAARGIDRWRASAVDSASVLRSLLHWTLQGVTITPRWVRRSEGEQPIADALSGAIPRLEWRLHPEYASALWDLCGGWDCDLFASEASALAPSYASYVCPASERAALLSATAGSTGLAARDGPREGFLGDAFGFTWSDATFYAYPPWSLIPKLALQIMSPHSSNMSLLLIVQEDAGTFWWRSLAPLRPLLAAAYPLDPQGSLLPLIAPDGNPACARHRLWAFLYARGSVPARRRPHPHWWSPSVLLRAGDVHPHPGPWSRRTRPQKRSLVTLDQILMSSASALPNGTAGMSRASHTPRSPRPSTALRHNLCDTARQTGCLDLRVHPVPTARLPGDPDTGAHTGPGGGGDHPRTPDPATPTRDAYHVHGPQGHTGMTPREDHLNATTSFTLDPQLLVDWLSHLIGIWSGDRLAPTTAEGLLQGLPHHQSGAMEELRSRVRIVVAASYDTRDPLGTARRIRDFANQEQHAHFRAAATTIGDLDAICLAYAIARLTPSRPVPGWAPVQAPRVAAELSRFRSACKRLGYTLPYYCGLTTASYLSARGAFRPGRGYSSKYPVHLRSILAQEPPPSHPDRPKWEALVVQSLFCLRPGIMARLTYGSLTSSAGGFILRWVAAHKRDQGDRLLPPHKRTTRRVLTSAARHHALDSLRSLSDLDSRVPDDLIFPGITTGSLTAYVKAHLIPADIDPAFTVGAHGVRVARSQELKELHVPDHILDRYGWWSSDTTRRRSQDYYAGLNIEVMMLISSYFGSIDFEIVAPAEYFARPLRPLPNWDQILPASASGSKSTGTPRTLVVDDDTSDDESCSAVGDGIRTSSDDDEAPLERPPTQDGDQDEGIPCTYMYWAETPLPEFFDGTLLLRQERRAVVRDVGDGSIVRLQQWEVLPPDFRGPSADRDRRCPLATYIACAPKTQHRHILRAAPPHHTDACLDCAAVLRPTGPPPVPSSSPEHISPGLGTHATSQELTGSGREVVEHSHEPGGDTPVMTADDSPTSEGGSQDDAPDARSEESMQVRADGTPWGVGSWDSSSRQAHDQPHHP